MKRLQKYSKKINNYLVTKKDQKGKRESNNQN